MLSSKKWEGLQGKSIANTILREERAFSHQVGVVQTRDRVDLIEGTVEEGKREAFESEEDMDTK